MMRKIPAIDAGNVLPVRAGNSGLDESRVGGQHSLWLWNWNLWKFYTELTRSIWFGMAYGTGSLYTCKWVGVQERGYKSITAMQIISEYKAGSKTTQVQIVARGKPFHCMGREPRIL